MSSRRFIIGDVHGHYAPLCQLLEAIAPGQNDAVYFLGDLIDRGPNSAQVVELVKSHRYRCVLGNHEQMLLEVLNSQQSLHGEMFQGWLYSGGYSTLLSYNHKIPQDHIDWWKTLPNYLDLGDIWLVHAGVVPYLTIEQQSADNFCWVRDEFHSMTKPYFSDKLIITGHTITFTFPGITPGHLVAGSGWLDIDTGVYHPHSGWLTGVDMTNKIAYQVHSQTGESRQLPLEEITTLIGPEVVQAKRQKMAG